MVDRIIKSQNRNSIKKRAFTLAEALITLVIIGVIAALTIPAILVNTEQHEYKSALKKALSSINQVIELNIALEGYGPIEAGGMTSPDDPDNPDSLFNMFRARMNVISTTTAFNGGSLDSNYAFYTADGMRFEFPTQKMTLNLSSKKDGDGKATKTAEFSDTNGHCATYVHIGEKDDPNDLCTQDDSGTAQCYPCLIIVDVNGDRRPNPLKTRDSYKVPSPKGKSKILDVFPIIITDRNAIPFGIVGQRAMFQHN